MRHGEKAKAEADWKEALKQRPICPEDYVTRGDSACKRGLLDRAAVQFQQAISLDPNRPLARVGYGQVLAESKKYDEAIQAFNEAIRLERGRLGRAAVEFQQAISLDPNRPLAPVGYGQVLAESKKTDETIQAFNVAFPLEPDLAQAYAGRGYAYEANGQPEKAQADFKEAHRWNPQWGGYYGQLALMYRIQGRPDKAIAVLTPLIRNDPKSNGWALWGRLH